MTRYVFLACILTLVSYTVAADVLSQFVLPGSQCPADVSIDANGRIATLVIDQNVAGLLLFNPDLSLRFNRRFSSSGTISPSDIASTSDGGFIVVGAIALPSGDRDAIVFKVSSAGNIVWKKIFGTAENDELHGVTVLQDGSIAVLGHRISASTSYDLLIARLSKGGALLWRKVLGTPSLDHGSSITSANGPALMVSAGTGIVPVFTVVDQAEFERHCPERARWIHEGIRRSFLHGESERRVLSRKPGTACSKDNLKKQTSAVLMQRIDWCGRSLIRILDLRCFSVTVS